MEIVDGQGRRLARRRLAEGVEGIAGLHALIAGSAPGGWADLDAAEAAGQVKVGTGTDRGPWVQALIAAGYEVFAIGPMSASRYRERHPASGAKSDAGDAHVLAGIVRLDRAHHRPVAGDPELGEAIKLVACSHQSLVWDRTRHVLRLRSVLREFFPAALDAFADLGAADALELLRLAPDPDRAARLTTARITVALRRARRRQIEEKAAAIRAALRAPALRQPGQVQAALAAITASQVRLIAALNTGIAGLGEVVAAHFGRHRDAEIYTSQPGPGVILAARVLGEFGDDPHRFADAKARKNYAGTSPVTRASGTRKVVLARYARNQRLADAVQQQASGSLKGSPGARAYYDELRARNGTEHCGIDELNGRLDLLTSAVHGLLDEVYSQLHRSADGGPHAARSAARP